MDIADGSNSPFARQRPCSSQTHTMNCLDEMCSDMLPHFLTKTCAKRICLKVGVYLKITKKAHSHC